MQPQFDPKMVLETMQKKKVTSAMMVPTMINFLLDVPDMKVYDLSALEWIMVGGAPMSPANARRMMEKLGCQYLSGYGLTETCPLLTVGNLKEPLADIPEKQKLEYLTRTGLEVVGADLRVVNSDGEDVPWDGKTIGEIAVRGDNVMTVYWNLPEETDKVIRNSYFYTGDLANIDSEGYVLIVDRLKDIIISGGENIASVEIENTLYMHPDILECAVIALEDKKWGEVPQAIVVLRESAIASKEDIMDFCRDRLAGFKVPKQISFMQALPKTGSGKILKTELRKK